MSNDSGRYTLALDEARRALDRQAAELASVRDRMTTLVSVGGLAAAFIGGLAVRDDAPMTGWTFAGVASFAALLVVTVVVLLPRRFVLSQRADDLVGWADEDDADTADMARDLALHMSRHYRWNAQRLGQLTWLYVVGLALLLAEIVLLLVDLRGR